MLSAILFIPVLGAILLAMMPRQSEGGLKATAFGVSLLVGLFFGIYPANRAASLRPIDWPGRS